LAPENDDKSKVEMTDKGFEKLSKELIRQTSRKLAKQIIISELPTSYNNNSIIVIVIIKYYIYYKNEKIMGIIIIK